MRAQEPTVTTVMLVEGASDRCALEALARRCRRDLAAEGIRVVSMGGATNIGHFLERLGPHGLDLRLAGLCDAGEQRYFVRGLDRAGVHTDLASGDLERLGFFVCVEDLEDELIRSLGAPGVVEVIAAAGELASFRILQKQPAQRDRGIEEQLRRFLGSQSGRKTRYAQLLVDALDLSRLPRPLERALAYL